MKNTSHNKHRGGWFMQELLKTQTISFEGDRGAGSSRVFLLINFNIQMSSGLCFHSSLQTELCTEVIVRLNISVLCSWSCRVIDVEDTTCMMATSATKLCEGAET